MNAVLQQPRRAPQSADPIRGAAAPPGWPDFWPAPADLTPERAVAELRTGACLSQPVFHAVYERTPPGFKAELVEGVVFMASPLSRRHGTRHVKFGSILSLYEDATPGVEAADNTSVVCTGLAESQPDLYMRVRRDHGGRSRTFSQVEGVRVESDDDGDHLTTGPEFVLEVAKSSLTLDLNGKRRDYRAGGVEEYVVADIQNRRLVWFHFAAGTDAAAPVPEDGVVRSRSLPGLWLDGPALFRGDGLTARKTLDAGLATPEHAVFIERLAAAKAARDADGGGGS